MTGVEIDFVVPDSRKALELYDRIFDIERIEVTDFAMGQNEALFALYDLRFHLLDENPAFDLVAPKQGDPKPMWLNIMVPDIQRTYRKAMDAGCLEIQPVKEIPDFGVSNGIFSDPFGYIWMLHQVHREVSFEERNRLWEKNLSG